MADLNPTPTGGRTWTPDEPMPDGSVRITVRRCCNGCSRELGDVTDSELGNAMLGLPLPDVRVECGCEVPNV